MTLISRGRRMTDLAAQHGDDVAVVFVAKDGTQREVTWREFESTANRYARLLEAKGARAGTMIVIGLPNSPEHLMATTAAWKLGACALPLRFDLPPGERERVLGVADASAIIADWPEATITPDDLANAASYSDAPHPDRVADPFRAIPSSGSTGRPKLIVAHGGGEIDPDSIFGLFTEKVRLRNGQVHIIIGPLYHVNAFSMCHNGLFAEHKLVLFEKFDAGRVLDAIEEHRVNTGTFVPTVAHRLLQHPTVRERDYSSIESILIGGSACPEWVKRAWIDILGPEKVIEGYGATESIGATLCDGHEWLAHPGTCGKGIETDVKILRDDGTECARGEIGLLYLRPVGATEVMFHYVGAEPPRSTEDAFVTLGDLAWMDEDDYVYIADRRVDMIISGGANVFPAEVEGVLSEHPDVQDVGVVGVPDERWGRRVHAVVVPHDREAPPDVNDLDAFCRQRLAAYKRPKSYEFVDEIPHTESGKIQHHVLFEERQDGPRAGWLEPTHQEDKR